MLQVDLMVRKSVFLKVALDQLDYVLFTHAEIKAMPNFLTVAKNKGLAIEYFDSEVCISNIKEGN